MPFEKNSSPNLTWSLLEEYGAEPWRTGMRATYIVSGAHDEVTSFVHSHTRELSEGITSRHTPVMKNRTGGLAEPYVCVITKVYAPTLFATPAEQEWYRQRDWEDWIERHGDTLWALENYVPPVLLWSLYFIREYATNALDSH